MCMVEHIPWCVFQKASGGVDYLLLPFGLQDLIQIWYMTLKCLHLVNHMPGPYPILLSFEAHIKTTLNILLIYFSFYFILLCFVIK